MAKERVAANEQRLMLASEEQRAVTRQIEVLKHQLAEATIQLDKLRTELATGKVSPANLSKAIAQVEKAAKISTSASTTVNALSDANNTLADTLLFRSRDLFRDPTSRLLQGIASRALQANGGRDEKEASGRTRPPKSD